MLNKSKRLFFLSVLVFIAVLAACSHSTPEETQKPTSEIKAQVAVMREQALPIHATFPGVVIAANEVQVASRLMGYVRELPVHEGQKVKKGELLLSLDPSDVRGGIDQAKAALLKAESVLADAKSNYERFQVLYEQKAVPEQQFQQVEMGYRVAKGNYAAATAALQQAHSQLTYVEVRAPFAGTVVDKFIDIGQLAAPGRPLLTLQSSGILQIQVQVNQQAFAQLHIGQNISVDFDKSNFESHTVAGVVERLVGAADPMTHTHTVKLSLPEDSGASSGDYARVRIEVGVQQGIVVPQSALQRRAGIDGVFVVDAAGQAAFRMVRLGKQSDSGVVVLAGLVPGDRVIINAQGELNNGVKVQPVRSNGA